MTLHIVYADDDLDIAAIVAFALESEPNCELTICASGQEVLQLAAVQPPDLVMLELSLPDIGGRELFRQLRELPGCSKLPVVFVTELPLYRDTASLRTLGAIDILVKPFNPMILASQIQHIWRYASRL